MGEHRAARTDTAIDDPIVLAEACANLPRPWLIGVDVDGTLAPIVARPELSALAPGALDALQAMIDRPGVSIAVVSGRPLADLRHRFGLPSSALLLGSHGAEVGTEVDHRTDDEQSLLDRTETTLAAACARLPGAWIEHKPLAVALHVRQVDDVAGEQALSDLAAVYGDEPGVTIHRGHKVIELAIRPTSKRSAFATLRARLVPATTFFFGDDSSDERVFDSLGVLDVSVKVGHGQTVARQRLADPAAVVELLGALAASLNTGVQ